MARTFVFLAAFLGCMLASGSEPVHSAPTAETKTVYVCMGPESKRYHLERDCRGLRNCSTPVERISLARAKEMGRTLCGFED